ncbi:type III effector Hop protein [Pseudomonas gingeri NCPPB 3146 = LMG 5327]|uniref:Type III effector Hop protein n=2 Tax=Pseudomonas gingeri TaxID=117681 RepID=A0A7Y7XXE7_9PSED|nr:RAQPRD family integrative conjugative element protein [Pseudomonas gingeri]NWC13909.1 type III effector Hop protein [Pseudomonas gingeri]NWE68834.1 type III effector Hop protein [Pseudomonas gingeri]PNQ90732.1 type III effector Hop protein [Pseudomonas gingeri NCPPB 3146 = LMG 5327]
MPIALRPLRYTALAASLGIPLALAEPTAHERTHLAGLLRQLDVASRQANASAALPTDEQARFSFDYRRLSSDLELVRQGIEGYLSPSRAQPRVLPELTGHYTRSGGVAP